VTTFEIAAYGALWGMVALMATIALMTVIKSQMPGARRDRRDDERVLLAYLDAWDLTAVDIRKTTRLGINRTHCALMRLENNRQIESYEHEDSSVYYPRPRRYALTNTGREAVLDLERAKIDDIRNDHE
jgi:hypothetical protein